MYDRILIPTDGGEAAKKGAQHGIELAAEMGAEVHALYVVKLPGAPRTVYLRDDEDDMRTRYREYGEEVTAEICEMAEAAGVDCTTAMESGSIRENINAYAEDHDVDLIVIGAGYRGQFGALLGGTAEKVVRTAPVPVTTIRLRADD